MSSYHDGDGWPNAGKARSGCESASITGSISASITDADKNSIRDKITSSVTMQNLARKTDIHSISSIQSGLAKTTDLNGLAKTTDLSALAKVENTQTVDDKDGYKIKSGALLAKEARDKVSEVSNQITNIENKIIIQPTIIDIKGINGATCTKEDNFSLVVKATNATQYRAGVNNNYTLWQTSPQINNIQLPNIGNIGANSIEVQVRGGEDKAIMSEYITVFRIEG